MSMYHFSDSDAVEHDINTVPESGDFDMVEVDGREYWPVNRDALLALADEMYRDGRMQRERQKAGDHWFVDGLDVMEYAQRIREALGVER